MGYLKGLIVEVVRISSLTSEVLWRLLTFALRVNKRWALLDMSPDSMDQDHSSFTPHQVWPHTLAAKAICFLCLRHHLAFKLMHKRCATKVPVLTKVTEVVMVLAPLLLMVGSASEQVIKARVHNQILNTAPYFFLFN